MTNPTIVGVLPIGEIDTDSVKSDFRRIVTAVDRVGGQPIIADPVTDEGAASRTLHGLAERPLELLLLVPLRGLSAPIIETAAKTSNAPCLIWPVQGRFALPSSTLAVGALDEAGARVELLYAPPENDTAIERLRCTVNAARAFSRIRTSRIGVVGGLFPNLVSCRYDPQTIQARLGVTFVPISFDEIRHSLGAVSQFVGAIQQLQEKLTGTFTMEDGSTQALESGIQLHVVLRQIAQDKKLDAFAAECWTGLPRALGLNPCLGFMEDSYVLACEGDGLLAVSLLLVRYVTGAGAYVGDLYDVDMEGILTLVHCGAPASLASGTRQVVLGKSLLAEQQGFETITCRPPLGCGTATLFRFYGENCDHMHIAMGEVLSSEQSPNLTVRVKLNGDRWEFLQQALGNHYLLVAGDIRNELKLLCRWLAINWVET